MRERHPELVSGSKGELILAATSMRELASAQTLKQVQGDEAASMTAS